MNPSELTGTLHRELTLKKDKNGNDYYLGKLICDDGSQKVCFFFEPSYNLSMRLVDLKAGQEITVQGREGKNPATFITTGFFVEEKENAFDFENEDRLEIF